MLDYAANAVIYWPVEKIQAGVEDIAAQRGRDVEMFFREFLGEDQDIAEFWQRVKANLLSGRVRLVFVADEIPRELKRIVEFLNQQMSPAEIYAVEVKQYVGEGIRSLVPRVVGVTGIKSVPSPSGRLWDKIKFLDVLKSRGDERELEAAKEILAWAEARGLRIAWGSGASDGAFYPMLDTGEVSHYTFCVRTGWKTAYVQVQFALMVEPFGTLDRKPELADKIQRATGARLSEESLNKYPSIKLATLDGNKLQKFLDVFDWYIEECKSKEAV